MNVAAYHTPPVTPGMKLTNLLDANLPAIGENSIVVVTSKIISICQGRMVKNDGTISKDDIIKKEAEKFVPRKLGEHQIYLTVKDDTLIANAGVDESNADGYFILWPDKPQKQAADLWKYIRTKLRLKNVGVLITDSYLAPLRWGTRGFGLAWCGFMPLHNYIGTPDVFGRPLRMTQASLLDGLAAAAVTVMGEGNEQTPLAVITDAPVEFTDSPPTVQEINSLHIDTSEDLYSPLLTSVHWQEGKKT
jgi:putative folate metabolism gamma-glutamate ligase